MNRRLSSTDRDSIKDSLSDSEKIKELFCLLESILDMSNFLRKNKLTILTKTTTKIAAEGKYHTGNLPRIIKEREPLES